MSTTTRREESLGSSARNRQIDPEVDNHVRKLLTLTVVSGLLYLTTVITNIITGQVTHRAFEDAPFGAPPESAYWVGAVVGLILLVGMYRPCTSHCASGSAKAGMPAQYSRPWG